MVSLRREVLKPTLTPRKLHFWLKDYKMEANAKFGDASVYTFTEVEPSYTEDNVEVYLRDKLGLRNLNGLNPEILKLNQREWFSDRARYKKNLVDMFHDMLLHFSDESANLVESFREEYDRCVSEKNPQALLALVKRSHTQAGRVASREEKEQKKDRLC